MKLGGLDGLFYRSSEIIARLTYLSLLWLLFTLMGLVIFGFTPATIALFTVTRKWILKEEDIPIFKTFWNVFKKEFLKANLLGLLLLIAGYILYVDLAFLPTTSTLFIIVRYLLIAISSVYLVILLYISPLYVHYNGNIKSYIKNSIIYGLSYPLITFVMIIGTIILFTILAYIPALAPFFGASALAFMNMWLALNVFDKIEEKMKKNNPSTNEKDSNLTLNKA